MDIIKRNGTVVSYNEDKIIKAVENAAFDALGVRNWKKAEEVADLVYRDLSSYTDQYFSVEYVQDQVESALMSINPKVAKTYILYRYEKERQRKDKKQGILKDSFISKYKHLPDPFPTELGKIVYYRTYSRPVEKENRRERWWETVVRVVEHSAYLEMEAIKRSRPLNERDMGRIEKTSEELFDMIYNLKLFPSGRTLWTGNTVSAKTYGLSGFNCSFVTIDSFKKFAEIFSVLMLGTGAGLSVEKKYINKLPKINTGIEIIHKNVTRVPAQMRKEFTEMIVKSPEIIEIVVGDSKFGRKPAAYGGNIIV